MGMSGSPAGPQRAELMGRVGVIPYLNDRQERIKKECWWIWWYRWVMLWCGGEIQRKGGRGDGLKCCVCGWIWGLIMGRGQVWGVHSCSAQINHQEDKHNQVNIYPQTARHSLSSSELQHPWQVFACVGTRQHSSTALHHRVFLQLDLTQQSSVTTPRQQRYLFINLKSSLAPQDGRNTHATVIQYNCQSHFEDSYEQAGRRVK